MIVLGLGLAAAGALGGGLAFNAVGGFEGVGKMIGFGTKVLGDLLRQKGKMFNLNLGKKGKGKGKGKREGHEQGRPRVQD